MMFMMNIYIYNQPYLLLRASRAGNAPICVPVGMITFEWKVRLCHTFQEGNCRVE
uniref:Uncharacterized protein n=1 Tax=Salix viminalis TaxID=40686 RepID=A0A6N2KMR5_SALVM